MGKREELRPAGWLVRVAQGLAGVGERARANYRLLSSLGPEALLAQRSSRHDTRALGLLVRLGLLNMTRKEDPARPSSATVR